MTKDRRVTWKEATKKVWYAYNLKEEYLGSLQYQNVGRHIHWCWYQTMDVYMSPGCLQEVRDKQKELININRKHKTGSQQK